MLRVYGYERVSTVEQKLEGYSLDVQAERIKKYCEAQGYTLCKIFSDGGYTGANMNRPALKELISEVKKRNVDKVIVYKLDRLSRSQKDTLHLIEDVFLANGVDFESISERFDTGSSFGRAMVGVLAVFAQLEREQIKERMAMGKEGRAKDGLWHGGGYAPIGYDYIEKRLVINDYEALMVREAYNLYAKGTSIKQIEQNFRDKGYKHKHGGFNHTTLRRMLENNVYIGMVKHKGELYKGVHEPLIDEELFNAVYARRTLEKSKGSGRPSKATYLSGLLYCARCGSRYACTAHTDNGKYRYYTCYSRRRVALTEAKAETCDNKNYRVDKLDEIIFNEIRKLSLDTSEIKRREGNRSGAIAEDKAAIISAEIKRLEDKRLRFLDLYGEGSFDIESLSEKVKEVDTQIESLQAEIEALKATAPALTEAEAIKMVTSFSDILDRGVYEEIRLVIETLIESITIDGEDITIKWRFR